jgi:2-succinyl-6-hydroxy-2,4-cyclohexadiene-1-carboxylate synthase
VLGLGNMPPLGSRLAALPARLTLVAGAEDARFVAEAERIARLAPQARCCFVAGAGHNVALEAPAELARIVSG